MQVELKVIKKEKQEEREQFYNLMLDNKQLKKDLEQMKEKLDDQNINQSYNSNRSVENIDNS